VPKKPAIQSNRNIILAVSKDPTLSDIRVQDLKEAGYQVISANNLLDMRKACDQSKIGLMIIGYSVPAIEKRKVWVGAKEFCKTPILELYEDGRHELMETVHLFVHEYRTPTDFLAAVNFFLNGSDSAPLERPN
jgi:hypothetical protein